MTSDKRREVAENLRRIDDEAIALIDERMDRLTNDELSGIIVLNIGLCIAMCDAGLEAKTLGDFWDLLADLIDPTCVMRPVLKGFRCSACGTYHGMRGFEEFPWPRCPDCGARVVRPNGD